MNSSPPTYYPGYLFWHLSRNIFQTVYVQNNHVEMFDNCIGYTTVGEPLMLISIILGEKLKTGFVLTTQGVGWIRNIV